jgi:hypothetical protein
MAHQAFFCARAALFFRMWGGLPPKGEGERRKAFGSRITAGFDLVELGKAEVAGSMWKEGGRMR